MIEHEVNPDGMAHIAIVNENLGEGGLGLAWHYKIDELPILNHWIHVEKGCYVWGIEPGNCNVRGRAFNRNKNTLAYIQPGDSYSFTLQFEILDGPSAIGDFEDRIASL